MPGKPSTQWAVFHVISLYDFLYLGQISDIFTDLLYGGMFSHLGKFPTLSQNTLTKLYLPQAIKHCVIGYQAIPFLVSIKNFIQPKKIKPTKSNGIRCCHTGWIIYILNPNIFLISPVGKYCNEYLIALNTRLFPDFEVCPVCLFLITSSSFIAS